MFGASERSAEAMDTGRTVRAFRRNGAGRKVHEKRNPAAGRVSVVREVFFKVAREAAKDSQR